MKGRCACGQVTLALPARPDYINICNCGLCRPTGTACGYYRPEELTLTGEVRGFQRDDLDDVWLTSHFCPNCGSTTHWTPANRAPLDRIGVNMRLFPLDDLEGVPVKYQDGRAVFTEDDEFITTATGHIGDGKAF
jgi:hypothetical protein